VTIGLLYIGLLLFGVFFAILSGAMGWFSDIGDGGHDVQVDASGHLDAGHAHPVSGTTIATFITGFGAGGTLAHYLFHWQTGGSLAFATGSGLALAGAAYLVLDLIFSQTQAGSEFGSDALIGRNAEVTTPIPENGAGEIAYDVKGQRETAAARTVDGAPLGRGKQVVIDHVTGSTLYVKVPAPRSTP
jgi:membrane protein implicated in regulation of membrane protease activity